MKKNHWIIIASVSTVLLVGIVLFVLYPSAEKSRYEIATIIPEETAILIQFENIDKVMDFRSDSSQLNQDLLKLAGLGHLLEYYFSPIDTLQRNSLHRFLLEMNACKICLIPESPGQFSSLFIVEEKQSPISFSISNHFDDYPLNKNRINGESYYSGLWGTDSVFLAYPNGYILASTTRKIILNTLTRLKETAGIPCDSSLSQIIRTGNQHAIATLFINHQRIPNLFKSLEIKGLDNYINGIQHFGSWSGWDMAFTENEIFLTGFTVSDSSQSKGMDIWMKSQAGSNSLAQAIPSNHLAHSIHHFDTIQVITEGEASASWNPVYAKGRKSAIKRWEKDGFYKMDARFYELLGSDFAFVRTSLNPAIPGENRFVVAQLKSGSESEKYIRDFFNDYAYIIGGSPGNFTQTFALDESTSFRMYRFPYERLAYVLFGSMFKEFESNWIAIFDNYLIIAEDDQSLGKYLTELFRRNSLKNNTSYAEFANDLSEDYLASFYLNIWKSIEYLEYPLGSTWEKNLIPGNILKNFEAICMQTGTTRSDNMLANDIIIKYNPNIVEKPETIWEIALDTTICIKPAIVTNHTNNSREILVQDINHKLYLINYAGRILWEKQLESKIISKIVQVDYFKNKKLQYLFNTEEKVHLIDRNGDYVGRYPVLLAESASNGLTIIKQNDKNGIKYCLALHDLTVRMYNLDGNQNKDWKIPKTETSVNQEILYVYDRKKPMIAYHDANRLYLMNLKGEEAIQFSTRARPSENPLYLQADERSGKKYLIYTDVQGTIIRQGFDDSMEQVDLNDFSGNHYLLFADINRDGQDDFILADGPVLSVYNQKGKLLFSRSFDNPITESPTYYQFSRGKTRIGVVTGANNSIHLIQDDGTEHAGFPLKGYTSFSISTLLEEGHFTLLVGDAGGYLFHYDIK
ncbi:MAG: hypothetical protein K9I34_07065 [Bacteroidales bacterium]|nr:hypothetical protein [Bacteroidales bacterium]